MKWFSNLKIGAKMIAAFIAVALISGIVGALGIVNIQNINKGGNEIYENMLIPMENIAEAATVFQMIRVYSRDMIAAETPEETERFISEIDRLRSIFGKAVNDFEAADNSPAVEAAYEEFTKSRLLYIPLLDQSVALARAGEKEEAMELIHSSAMQSAVIGEQDAISAIFNLKLDEADALAVRNATDARNAGVAMVGTIVGGMLLAIILGVFTTRSIVVPVKSVVGLAGKIADGDLDIELDNNAKKAAERGDEIGFLVSVFIKMGENLNDVISNFQSAAEQVAAGARQVSSSSMALSQGAAEQASSVEELTASIEQITVQTNQNAEKAVSAKSLAEDGKDGAIAANDKMRQMLEAMEEINQSSTNVSKIIRVIDDIAFQTNILALNAAVEAARAGQHGKGFAVVAEEVRNLAARSAQAASETTAMIESSIKNVTSGTKIAKETDVMLANIVEGSAAAADLVGQIAIASNEQAAGIAQITQGINQISQVVQENSATAEESASASEELSGQAAVLKEETSKFKIKADYSKYKPEDKAMANKAKANIETKADPQPQINLGEGNSSKY